MDKATNVPVSTAPSLRTVGSGASGNLLPRRILVAIPPMDQVTPVLVVPVGR